jgi:hypothetical protein
MAETRLLVSVESAVFKSTSAALSDDTDAFINETSEETATLRSLTSLERDVLNPVSTTIRESTPELSVLVNVETLVIRVLVSAERMLCRVESTTDKEDADVLNAVDKDATEALRVLVSVEIAVLRVESTTVREDADVLNVLDKDEVALLRTDVSVESAVEREMYEFKILVAKAASGPISFFKLVNVSMDELKLLIAPMVEVKKDSVANTLELYLGCVVKFQSPFAETNPVNVAFPTTLIVLIDALVMFATLTYANGMDALLMVASPMLAF